MKDPCSLSCISKSVASRSREIIILIHLRVVRPPPGRLCPGLAPQYKIDVDKLQHGQQKGPTVESWSTQHARRSWVCSRENAKGASNHRLLLPKRKVVEKMEPDSEKGAW